MATVTNVNEFITQAVLEGVAEAPFAFMTQLEESLKMDVAISKSGSVDAFLQKMIEEQAQVQEQDQE